MVIALIIVFMYTCSMMKNVIQLFSISQKGYVELATLLVLNIYGEYALLEAIEVCNPSMQAFIIIS